MHDDELLARVRALRAEGHTPKSIARALRIRPADVVPLIRKMAAADAAGEPAVVGCWVSPGWSMNLAVADHSDWPDVDTSAHGLDGVASVAVVRQHRSRRVSVCGFLVDVYCLGVKNALGPHVLDELDLPDFLRAYFAPFDEVGGPLPAPLELARHLVWGAVDHARRLGFEPAADFGPAAGHLGRWEEHSAITFGRNGTPFYVAGPYDRSNAVLRTLCRTVGEGNFDYAVPATVM